ncbi:MAG: hypothetical protein PVG47_05630 [Chromatiales bacterium]
MASKKETGTIQKIGHLAEIVVILPLAGLKATSEIGFFCCISSNLCVLSLAIDEYF